MSYTCVVLKSGLYLEGFPFVRKNSFEVGNVVLD